jgi:hypothetical protein
MTSAILVCPELSTLNLSTGGLKIEVGALTTYFSTFVIITIVLYTKKIPLERVLSKGIL